MKKESSEKSGLFLFKYKLYVWYVSKIYKTVTNCQIIITYRDSVNNGKGWKKDLDEAKSDFDSVLRRNTHWIAAELYFNNVLVSRYKSENKKVTKRNLK